MRNFNTSSGTNRSSRQESVAHGNLYLSKLDIRAYIEYCTHTCRIHIILKHIQNTYKTSQIFAPYIQQVSLHFKGLVSHGRHSLTKMQIMKKSITER